MSEDAVALFQVDDEDHDSGRDETEQKEAKHDDENNKYLREKRIVLLRQ